MKTKFLILALLVLTIALSGCSQEVEESSTAILSPVVIVGDEGEGVCLTLWAGQDIDVGTVCVSVIDEGDSEQLRLTYNTTGGWELVETHAWVGASLSDMPQTKKGNPKIGLFPYPSGNIASATSWEVLVELSEWGTEGGAGGNADLCEMMLYAAAHAVVQLNDGNGNIIQTETGWADGDDMGGRSWATYFSINLDCTNDSSTTVDECETAYAYGCDDFANCFIDLPELDDPNDPSPARWGWTNGPLANGTFEFDIYAGAGQCNTENGTLVGMLSVDYSGSSATVTYTTYDGFQMDEIHLYVGNEVLPISNDDYTIANGKLGHEVEFDSPTSSYSYTVTGLTEGAEIYVIAHAVVCGEFDAGLYYEPVCDLPCDEWIVYGSNLNAGADLYDDAIYAYDLKNETQTLVYDPTPIDGNLNYPNANAYDPVNNRIYFGTDDGRLFYHEIGSGTHVQVEGGEFSGAFGIMACGAWYNGMFYYVEQSTDKLYEVDIVSDVATRVLIGNVPVSANYGDIAFDPEHPGRFVGSGIGSSTVGQWYWYDINDHTMANLTPFGPDRAHKQLAYGSDGVLYGVNAVSGEFFSIDYSVADGSVTLTADWESPYTFTDLASGPQCH